MSPVASNGTELPRFGKEMAKEWGFEAGWINLNHGSYGAAPNCVIKSMREYQDKAAAAPDRFMRVEYAEDLKRLRTELGQFVGCDLDDVVVLPNATTAVNVVLRSLTTVYKPNDKFLFYSTTIYNACSSTLQYIVDTHPHLNLSLVPIQLAYPISHDKLIALTRQTIEAENAKGNGTIRLALFDAISSNPGVIVPWEELVQLFKEKRILSLVDGAHQFGQLPVNLRQSQPDFFLSNIHKWGLAHRGCAMFYVAKAYQHLIHSIPTGHSYTSVSTPSPNGFPHWVVEFEWNGTCDWSPYLSTLAALEFRKRCGGEARINDYCHQLAVKGGQVIASILGTEVMKNEEGDGELIANMVNVRLPITLPTGVEGKKELSQQQVFLYSTLAMEHKTQAPGFVHNGKWYTRLSAQIYNDLDDFEKVGQALKDVCERVRNGEHVV